MISDAIICANIDVLLMGINFDYNYDFLCKSFKSILFIRTEAPLCKPLSKTSFTNFFLSISSPSEPWQTEMNLKYVFIFSQFKTLQGIVLKLNILTDSNRLALVLLPIFFNLEMLITRKLSFKTKICGSGTIHMTLLFKMFMLGHLDPCGWNL